MKKLGAYILLSVYPIHYLFWCIKYKSFGENAGRVDLPNTVYFLLFCAGIALYTGSDWKKSTKESKLVCVNYAGYLILFLIDALFRWNDNINTLYHVMLVSLTIVLCLLYTFCFPARSVTIR